MVSFYILFPRVCTKLNIGRMCGYGWLVLMSFVLAWAGCVELGSNFLSRYACMHEVQEIRYIPFTTTTNPLFFFEVMKKQTKEKE